MALGIAWETLLHNLVSAAIFGAVGVLLFAIAMKVIVKVSPFSVAKEISEDHNVALAVVIASIFLGLGGIVCVSIAT
jgi:uncharacterized membrane protein YjfL (UPF0719 family)